MGLLVVIGLSVGIAHPAERSLPAASAELLRGAVQAALDEQRIPGLSIAVSHQGWRWVEGFGLADVENGVAVTPETVFRLASVSKPITAVAALQLAEQGRLDLDAPVNTYLPELPEFYERVTVRQLLGHLAGVRHYRPGEMDSTTRYESVRDALAIFKDDRLIHEPGARFVYSTYGFNLVGGVVEAVSGTPFRDYLRSRIFEPAGMRTARDDDARSIIPHRAAGYRREPDGTLVNAVLADTSNKVPGGGLCATAADLVAFAEALASGRLVGPETLALMATPQTTTSRMPTGYGLGWNVGRHEGRVEVYHGGNQPRVTTILYTRPDQATAVAILTNLEGAQLLPLARQVADLVEAWD